MVAAKANGFEFDARRCRFRTSVTQKVQYIGNTWKGQTLMRCERENALEKE
jgi:hypothetical protein